MPYVYANKDEYQAGPRPHRILRRTCRYLQIFSQDRACTL